MQVDGASAPKRTRGSAGATSALRCCTRTARKNSTILSDEVYSQIDRGAGSGASQGRMLSSPELPASALLSAGDGGAHDGERPPSRPAEPAADGSVRGLSLSDLPGHLPAQQPAAPVRPLQMGRGAGLSPLSPRRVHAVMTIVALAAGPGCILSGKLFRPQSPPRLTAPGSDLTAGPSSTDQAGAGGGRSTTPGSGGDGEVVVQVMSLYVTKFPGTGFDDHAGLRFSLEVGRRQGAKLMGGQLTVGQARLTSSHLPECSSGLASKSETWEAGAVGEPDRLVVAFSRPAAVAASTFQGFSALDVQIVRVGGGDSARCVRIPIVNDGRDAQWVNRPFLVGAEERLMFTHSTAPGLRSPVLVFGAGVGAWAGRWRWMIEGEIGSGAAPPGTTDRGPLFDLLGGGASVSTILSSTGHLGLGALAAYEVLRGAPGGGTDAAGAPLPSLTLQGPRLGLRFLYLVDPLSWPGFRSPPDAWADALTLYVGNWWSGLDVSHPSPFLGVALEGNLGF